MIKELTGKHVLIMFLTFFGIVFSASGMLIYQSQHSWTGLETVDAYRKGIKYNQQLSRGAAQNRRHWSVTVSPTRTPSGDLSLRVEPKNKNNETLSGLQLQVRLKRPTHTGMDRSVRLSETGIGIYTGQFDKPAPGRWYLLISAERGGKVLYKSRNELCLRETGTNFRCMREK